MITLNVHGLQNHIKRRKLIAKLKKEQQQIFWQETHLTKEFHEKFKRIGFENTFYSSYANGYTRGVAIIVANNVDFQVTKQISEKEGIFVLVKGR